MTGWLGRCLLLVFTLWWRDLRAQTFLQEEPEVPERSVVGVGGTPAQLPCLPTTPTGGGDEPVLVLWYKDGARFPFYTLDLREGKQEEYVDPGVEGRVRSDPAAADLTFDPVRGRDSGAYKCRVDFEVSPTLFALVNLTVYVVPSRLVVLNEGKNVVPEGRFGPIIEGEKLSLVCVASGGHPAPEVTWWKGSSLLANRSLVLGYGDVGVGVGVGEVRTELRIPSLNRDYKDSNLTCRASNNDITKPLSITLALDLYLGPTWTRLRLPESPLEEGKEARLECLSEGAFPSTLLSWTKTSLQGISSSLPSTSRRIGDRTSSFVTFVPRADDDEATLTCEANNPNISGPGISTSSLLQVVFAPRVSLQLGANLGSQPITEGKDVYFECQVLSNPPAREIVWRKDEERITTKRQSGVLVSGRNLVLQMVRRTAAGNYTCEATNTLDTTISNAVHLHIRYLPVCVSGPQTVAVAEGETTRLSCEVDARPEIDLSFTWVFNNTLDTIEVEQDRFTVLQGLSTLDYNPRSARDYGTLSCWAKNAVGTQADPCIFTVIEAGPPERVSDCILVNLTMQSLEVGCSAGKDGGLVQRFVARVFAAQSHALLATIEEEAAPRFHVGGLTPGQDYLITVTAVNAKGASLPQQIDAVRLKVAEKRMVEEFPAPVSPLVGVFLGLVGGFVLLLVVGVLLSRARSHRCGCWRRTRRGDRDAVASSNSPPPTITPTSHALRELEGKAAPDVLRTINVTAELLETHICPEIIPTRVAPPPYSRTQAVTSRDSLELTSLAVASGAIYREVGSPLHLLNEESFV